jgi:hypothetical protein
MSSNDPGVNLFLTLVWYGLPAVAWAACVIANRMDRRDSNHGEAPTLITGVVAALALTSLLISGGEVTLDAAQKKTLPKTQDDYQNPWVTFCNGLEEGGYWWKFWDCDEIVGQPSAGGN